MSQKQLRPMLSSRHELNVSNRGRCRVTERVRFFAGGLRQFAHSGFVERSSYCLELRSWRQREARPWRHESSLQVKLSGGSAWQADRLECRVGGLKRSLSTYIGGFVQTSDCLQCLQTLKAACTNADKCDLTFRIDTICNVANNN